MSRRSTYHPDDFTQLAYFVENAAKFKDYSSLFKNYGSNSYESGAKVKDNDSDFYEFGAKVKDSGSDSYEFGVKVKDNGSKSYEFSAEVKDNGSNSYEYNSQFKEFDPFFLHDPTFWEAFEAYYPEQAFFAIVDRDLIATIRQLTLDLREYLGERETPPIRNVHPIVVFCFLTSIERSIIPIPCIIGYRIRDGTACCCLLP